MKRGATFRAAKRDKTQKREGRGVKQQVKEPIRYGWLWVVFVIILVFSVPWYFPAGSIYPIILGFPYWAAVCVVMSMVISGFLTYMMTNYWNMESLLEDGDGERRKAG